MCVCQRHLFRLCGEELGPSAAPQERFGGQFTASQLLGLGLERNLVHEKRHTMGADFVVPFIEQVKPCSIGAWLCCVFLQQLCYRNATGEMCEVLRGTGSCCSTPLGLVLSVRCSPLNFYELGQSKSLYYSKAPGAYFHVRLFTALLGCMSVQRLQSNSTVCCLGRSGTLDWNNCLP